MWTQPELFLLMSVGSIFHCPSFHSLETSSAVNSGRSQPSVSLFKISYNCVLLRLSSFSGPFCSLRFLPLLASASFVCWCFDWCLLGTTIFPLSSDSAKPWPRILLLPVTNSTLSNTSFPSVDWILDTRSVYKLGFRRLCPPVSSLGRSFWSIALSFSNKNSSKDSLDPEYFRTRCMKCQIVHFVIRNRRTCFWQYSEIKRAKIGIPDLVPSRADSSVYWFSWQFSVLSPTLLRKVLRTSSDSN